jgi:hypothetical protein
VDQQKHVMIDQGVPRGPRKKPGPKPSSIRRTRDNGQFIPKLPDDPDSIRKAMEAYASGVTTTEIGKQYGVSKQAVYAWLLGGLGDQDHNALVTRTLTSRIAFADRILEEADNPIDLARGRELARFARMDLERRRPHLYGQKQEITHVVSDLGDKLRRARERTIEGECAVVQQTPQAIDSVSGAAQQTESKSA